MTDALLPLHSPPYNGPPDLLLRFRSVRVLICDVDGVLTEGGVYLNGEGETKRFDIRDGLGLTLLRRQGIKVAWVSHRPSLATSQRAQELKIDFLHQAPEDKVDVCERCLEQFDMDWDDVCYMGDDIVDLGALRRARLAATVPDALREVRMVAHYRTKALGGRGAVREVVNHILRAQNLWQPLIEEYSI